MNVLLIDTPTSQQQIYGDWDLSALDTYCPPLGLLYIASFIRQHGYTPRVLDVTAERKGAEEVVEIVAQNPPQVVGFSAKTINVNNAHLLADRIKRKVPGVITVVGGAHVTALPRETLEEFEAFDFGVYGEGEATFLELLETLRRDMEREAIEGLVWRRSDGTVVVNKPRLLIEDLDTLPLPSWDLLKRFPDGYRHSALETKRLPAASIITSRGCPFNCTFCDRAIFGSRVRQHGAEYTINMIQHLVDEYGIRDLMFLDDNFVLDRRKLFAVCDAMLERKLDLSWYCMGHARYLSDDRIAKIREAGCWFLEIGIESGSDLVLRSIKKNTTKAEIADAVRRARKAGLKVKGNFIFGFPQDTRETLNETIQFAKSIDLSYFQQNFLTPWPGCEIAQQLKQRGQVVEDWRMLAHQRVTFVPDGLTREDLVRASQRAFREFYLRPKILIQYLSSLTSWRAFKNLITSGVVFVKTILRPR